MIRFECGHCEKTISAADDQAGKAVKCPSCGQLTLAETGEGTSARIVATPPPIPPDEPPEIPPSAKPPARTRPKLMTNTTPLAVLAFAMGIFSMFMPFFHYFFSYFLWMPRRIWTFGLICVFGGGICGLIAYLTPRQSRRGKRMALAGMIMSMLVLLLFIIWGLSAFFSIYF
ncbi:MAG: hypothetical protein HZA50_12930 [Planctomycetes bacterium]|nr:hypothetical protein [Planctomycetota bacterium]